MDVKTIVAGVDFLGSGLASARWVGRHLSPDRVILVHALHIPKPPKFLTGLWGDEEQVLVSARSGAQARLDEFARQLEDETGVSVETRIRVGSPAEQIGIAADSLEAELIVVGPHASRKGRWTLLGSTAVQLLHEARIPTVVGHGVLRESPERIMGTVDDSALAAGVPAWTKGLSERFGARPMLLHVLDVPVEAHLRAIEPPRDERPGSELTGELADRARGWLRETAEEVGLGEDTELIVAMGDPAFEILAAAERHAVDLIVVGTRGPGSITRAVMGSVADTVLRRAGCPVLALPTPELTGA
ncbi:MAG: universal stress protein [Gemmatimonadota bacterium]|nr:universal stress protein [Gemmatimonadota bacterium]